MDVQAICFVVDMERQSNVQHLYAYLNGANSNTKLKFIVFSYLEYTTLEKWCIYKYIKICILIIKAQINKLGSISLRNMFCPLGHSSPHQIKIPVQMLHVNRTVNNETN